jgi:S1-C subfamily serine protease
LKTLNKIIKAVESSASPKVKVAVAAILTTSLVTLSYSALQDKSDVTTSTVMITSIRGGGGSGVIISSSPSESLVLTNSHVCEGLANGGVVTTTQNTKHIVVSYKTSNVHDLCLLKVAANLPGKVTVATKAPTMYELATVSGHPNLMPNVVTTGHFSGHQIINVFVGVRGCTKDELKDPELVFVCFFFGGMPVIRTYEAVLVTATTMPGSSGSAVYNANKELSAIVFAGSGELSYAYSVPYQYVKNFLTEEAKTLPDINPNYQLDIKSLLRRRSLPNRNTQNLIKKCLKDIDTVENQLARVKIEETCQLLIRDANWRF